MMITNSPPVGHWFDVTSLSQFCSFSDDMMSDFVSILNSAALNLQMETGFPTWPSGGGDSSAGERKTYTTTLKGEGRSELTFRRWTHAVSTGLMLEWTDGLYV